MSVEVIGDKRFLSEEEFADLRRSYIGGSDAAGILGMSPWATPLSVAVAKEGKLPRNASAAMKWGNLLEPVIRNAWAEEHPEWGVADDPKLYRVTETPWIGGTIDGTVTDEDGVVHGLEIKTTSIFNRGEWKEGELPDQYYAQVQHYCHLMSLDGFWVVALIGGVDLREVFVPRNDRYIEWALPKLQYFWENYVEEHELPPPTGMSADSDILRMMFSEPEEVEPPKHLDGLDTVIEDYLEAKELLDRCKKEKEEREQVIKAALGNCLNGVCEGFSDEYEVKWSRWSSKVFNEQQFKQDHPELHAEYKTKDRPGQKLNINKISKEGTNGES